MTKLNWIYKLGFVPAVFILLTGCSAMERFTPKDETGTPAVAIDSVRGGPPVGVETKTRTVSKSRYQSALSKEGSVNSARLVEIYQRGKSSEQVKEYRLLDVRPDSIYDLLGLEHADIIVATNGYIIPTPQMFWSYLHLIGKFDEGNIEIRRSDQPLMINFKFIE